MRWLSLRKFLIKWYLKKVTGDRQYTKKALKVFQVWTSVEMLSLPFRWGVMKDVEESLAFKKYPTFLWGYSIGP